MSKINNENRNGQEKLEFRIFNQTIETIAIVYGIFLIVWGIIVSFVSQSQSFTSLIPSIFGLLLTVFSFLSLKFSNKKKLFMHIVVVIAFFITLGGADFFRGLFFGSNPFTNVWAGSSKLMMFLTGIIFIFICIKSFRFARKQKNNQIDNG